MKHLLEHLDSRTVTFTVCNFTGDPAEWRSLTEWLGSHGVSVREAETEYETPADTGVLHDGETLLDAVPVTALLDRINGDENGEDAPSEFLQSPSQETTVKANRSIEEMVRISREFERRAWRTGGGALHAGFQLLSAVADSERTRAAYRRLVESGVDVTVYGYPDCSLDDVPFSVVEDDDRALDAYWFLFYDGNGEPTRKSALISEECPEYEESEHGDGGQTTQQAVRRDRTYDSYWTTDAATVDRLYELAREDHPSILRPVWTPTADQ